MSLAPQTLFETALNLMSAVDERMTYTAGRTAALVALSRAIAEKLGVDPLELQRLEWACLFCDLGMLALPESLVLKPSTLTLTETQQLRGHVNLSLQMLANNPPPVPIADIVAAHHERYDGTGYPRGLRGEEVSFVANILSAADTLIALASDRPHRRGFDAGMIWQTISAERARQFYPEIIDALEEIDLVPYL
ncbi:MAG: HD domain-containing phosphohydrolase, partial [bacterium]